RLHCKSITLHINLFLAFILRASISFMKDRLLVNGLGLPQDVKHNGGGLEFILEGTHWECRTLFVMLMFAISASQTWMLMEGLYLYLLIHKTMATERLGVNPYVIVGWALPWTFLIPWIVVKSNFENTYCWNMQEDPAYFWILKGPWTAIVFINFFFFLDIIRVLMTRVRDSQRHAGRSQYRKFGKFILVLIPLFGIMYIVLNVAFPSEVQGRGYNVIYLYVEMGYNSFQGFILALLFCFLNEDVHTEIRRSWQRHKFRRQNSNIFRSSRPQSSWHRTSKSSGISQTANQNGFNTSSQKRSQDPQNKPLAKSLSMYSTFVSNGAALVNCEGSRVVSQTQLANSSYRNSFTDIGTKQMTFL
ncbi:unnamed protein product, partial [Candidula unifasciata]